MYKVFNSYGIYYIWIFDVILYIMYKLLSICISKFNDIGIILYIYVCMYNIDKFYMWFKRDKKLWMDDLMGCFFW